MGCAWCRSKVEQVGRGRPRRYCSQACRQRAYEMHKLARDYPGRTRRAIGALANRKRKVRDARNALKEAEVAAAGAITAQLAELRRSDPAEFEAILAQRFGSSDALLRKYWAAVERLEAAVREQHSGTTDHALAQR
jgi:hypothetical protein